MPTTQNNQRVPRATRKSRQAWLDQQKDIYRLRRLRREKDYLDVAIQNQKDAIKHMPLEKDELRQTKEYLEELKFDRHTVSHDIDYYSGY